jgi:hypothetical protein
MCRICKYNQVQDIDRLLLAGATMTQISQTYPFNPSELQRHQQHLTNKITQASKCFHTLMRQDLFCKLHTVMEMVLNLIRRSKNGDDPKLFLQATREFTRILKLIDKMAPQLQHDPEFIYCLMASHQWDLREDTLLPHAFQAMSETRRTLKSNLFSPCPDPQPEPESEPVLNHPQEDLPRKSPNPTANHSPDLFSEVCSSTLIRQSHEPDPGPASAPLARN